MLLGIELHNRMKRKAQAMGVFLNVETQRKFLKMASNVELQQVVKKWAKVAHVRGRMYEEMTEDYIRQDTEIRNFGQADQRIEGGE